MRMAQWFAGAMTAVSGSKQLLVTLWMCRSSRHQESAMCHVAPSCTVRHSTWASKIGWECKLRADVVFIRIMIVLAVIQSWGGAWNDSANSVLATCPNSRVGEVAVRMISYRSVTDRCRTSVLTCHATGSRQGTICLSYSQGVPVPGVSTGAEVPPDDQHGISHPLGPSAKFVQERPLRRFWEMEASLRGANHTLPWTAVGFKVS